MKRFSQYVESTVDNYISGKNPKKNFASYVEKEINQYFKEESINKIDSEKEKVNKAD